MSGFCNWVVAFASAVALPRTLAAQALGVPPLGRFAITDVAVVDVAAGRVAAGRTVIIADGRIVAVDSSGRRPPRGVTTISGRGLYLTPGLWDMHVHLAAGAIRAGSVRPPDYSLNPDWQFPLLLAHGVTGVRDMAGRFKVLRGWRDEVVAGLRPGPRIVHTGYKLRGAEPVLPGGPREAHTAVQIRQSVEMLADAGADFVKVETMTAEQLEITVKAARGRGLDVVGHVGPWLGLEQASKLGMKGIEHLHQAVVAGSPEEPALLAEADREFSWWGGYLVRWGWWSRADRRRDRLERAVSTWDSARAMRAFEVLAQNGTWMTPTLTGLRDIQRIQTEIPPEREAWLPPGVLDDDRVHYSSRAADAQVHARHFALQRRLVPMLARAGVPLLAGSDAPGTRRVPGLALVEELEALVGAGLTPAEALRAATLGPAEFLGATDSMGTVAPGKVADLVLLEGNPLADISALRRVRGVMAGGRYYSRAELDRGLEGVRELIRRLRAEAAPIAAASASAEPDSTR